MFFWFLGIGVVLVAWVFASPLLDYRLVMVGSVLPVVELIVEGPWVLHSLVAPVAVMAAVMLAFQGRRLKQRRWLGLAIGLFMYLVLSGSWRLTTTFWWPLFGWRPDGADIPTWPPLGLAVVMELAGIAALGWAYRRYGLDAPARRDRFVRSGHLSRDIMGNPRGSC